MRSIRNRDSKSWRDVFCCLLAVAAGSARAAVPGTVTGIYFFEVPPPLVPAFTAGWTNVLACIKSRGSKFTALTYHELGDRARYVVLEPYRTWSELDGHKHDAGEDACFKLGLWRYSVLPNFSKWSGEIAQVNLRLSYMSDDRKPAPMLWVRAYRVNPGERAKFIEAEEKWATAAAKIYPNAHFTGYDVYGAGEYGPNFLYLSSNRSWADIGQNVSSSAEQMMESLYGKQAAQAENLKLADSLAVEWSDVWIYDRKLSYIPAD